MVTNSLKLLVNQESDVMSFRSQRGRVTFCEEIEMDSLEPELFGKIVELETIKEFEFNGRNVEDELDDEHLNEFQEFDVSLGYETIKLNACLFSLCSKSSEKLSHRVQLCARLMNRSFCCRQQPKSRSLVEWIFQVQACTLCQKLFYSRHILSRNCSQIKTNCKSQRLRH